MKKTIIALFALAGLANADLVTTVYNPFSAETAGDWEMAFLHAQGSNDNKPTINDGVFTAKSNWKRSVGNYDFADSIKLTDKNESISFSFTLSGVDKNSVGTLALEGKDANGARALVMGETYKGTDGANNTNYAFASIAANSGDAYLLGAGEGWGGNTYNISTSDTSYKNLGTLSASTTFVGYIEWSDSVDAFRFRLYEGSSAAADAAGDTTGTNADVYFTLGSSYELTSLTVALDGWPNVTPSFSDFTITTKTLSVPEPTSATLSLLALAGLVMRRRRK